jgi:NAD+ kinase
MMIEAKLLRDNKVTASAEALNDVVISRQEVTTTLQVDMYIDQGWASTYNADALIIATATGSTAYALATGGPILPPDLRNILVLPVAPHLSMDRAIVLAEGSTVDAVPVPVSRAQVVVAVDGQSLWELEAGDRISVRASQHMSRFVRMRSHNYFYRSLLDRLEPRIKKPPSRPPLWLDEVEAGE